MSLRPIFLLSLPRSGSTLVQRVLGAHEEVSTAPEPWVLLPQVYAMRERGMYAEYGQVPSARAIREFVERLPGGPDDYTAELRSFIVALYARASEGRGTYFLDKTPRYHFIAEDLYRIFPDAGFVFLWRNPLGVVASIVETWAGGRWNVERWRSDLFEGVANIVAGYEAHADRSFAVGYEQLVSDPLQAWPPLFDYLELSFDPSLLSSFSAVRLKARMGDPTGSQEYDTLSTDPVDKWKRTLGTPVRRRWCRSYLQWIGEHRLGVMGYNLGGLLAELDSVPRTPGKLGSDLARGAYGWGNRVGRRTAARILWRKRPAGGQDLTSKGQISSP